jgi:hypothetical protein
MFFLILFLFSSISPIKLECLPPCYECPSQYFYNKGLQLTETINFESDCTLKSDFDVVYSKDFYLSNISCGDDASKCIGDANNPVDDFWKIIKIIYNVDYAHKYRMQNIKIFLLG